MLDRYDHMTLSPGETIQREVAAAATAATVVAAAAEAAAALRVLRVPRVQCYVFNAFYVCKFHTSNA